MNIPKVVGSVLGIMAGIGTDVIINNIIKSFTPAKMHTLVKLCVGVSGIFIGSMVGDKVEEYVHNITDDTALTLFGLFNPKEWKVKEVEA